MLLCAFAAETASVKRLPARKRSQKIFQFVRNAESRRRRAEADVVFNGGIVAGKVAVSKKILVQVFTVIFF